MPVLGAIDIGSNAFRMVAADVGPGPTVKVLDNVREAVRLGGDVFSTGEISRATREQAVRAMVGFRQRLDDLRAVRIRAVGTSALREATNREAFVAEVRDATGIEVEAIPGEEEARLVLLAVSAAEDLLGGLTMLIDIGGGSVEVALADGGNVVSCDSFKTGTVRLLNLMGGDENGNPAYLPLVREYANGIRRHVRQQVAGRPLARCVGTGGNVEALRDLQGTRLGRPGPDLFRDSLESLLATLSGMTVGQRVETLGLRPDRADVILPAAVVLLDVMDEAGIDRIRVPGVGLKDGLLLDLAYQVVASPLARRRDQVIASALRLGQRLAFDEAHAGAVARLAVRLFDATRDLHRLDGDDRLLLEVAAWLHDVGQFLNMTGHHKHSYYLVRNSPLVGLGEREKELVANVARYHRKAFPRLDHEPYRGLSDADRRRVDRLSALLRVADALDVQHGGKVEDLAVEAGGRVLTLHLSGRDDLLLEEWAVARKARLFEKVFGVQVVVHRERTATVPPRRARKGPRPGTAAGRRKTWTRR